ncbi:hypothetical protein CEXT_748601 [Caerostris extrusa]|uniref:Uncharacterized protein n=1 Tax=Caerostris extrusa TaxID=172846 RepID=A0AAV4Y360_CAEEX|nr:hypothetical protein CEXT_748601 [Caerostris extrusa]
MVDSFKYSPTLLTPKKYSIAVYLNCALKDINIPKSPRAESEILIQTCLILKENIECLNVDSSMACFIKQSEGVSKVYGGFLWSLSNPLLRSPHTNDFIRKDSLEDIWYESHLTSF